MTVPDFQPYPDEYQKIAVALGKLAKAFEFTKFSETNQAIFNIAANEEFAKIGVIIKINWQEICRPDGTPTGVWLPGVEPCGRVKEQETDHDRIAWGVTKGLADGQPGYIRADGSKHEEPIRKDIL